MTVRECVDQWPSMSVSDRAHYGSKLIDRLSTVSHEKLRAVQEEKQKVGMSYDVFVMHQRDAVRECVEFEVSEAGIREREEAGLPYLSWDESLM